MNERIDRALRAARSYRGRVAEGKHLAVNAAAIGIITFGVSAMDQARAADECGGEAPGADQITCGAGTYGTGITYTDSDGLELVLDDAAIIVESPGVSVTSSAVATDDITITATVFDTITTTGDSFDPIFQDGLQARHEGSGSARVRMDRGTITTDGFDADGLRAIIIDSPSSTGSVTARLTDGSIETNGRASQGIIAVTYGLGDADAQMDAGQITTAGEFGHGVRAWVRANPDSPGTATALFNGGVIASAGDGAQGVNARNDGLGDARAEMTDGDIVTTGANAHGLYSQITEPSNSVGTSSIVFSAGSVETSGESAAGLDARNAGSGLASVVASGGTVAALGLGAHGASAISADGPVEIDINTAVTGGRGDGAGLYASSEAAQTSQLTLQAGALVSAYSDRGVVAEGGEAELASDGTLFGTVTLTDNDDSFTNNSWNLRNFADTDADLVRDTEAVAVSDFGAGTDTYTNTGAGTLRLLTVPDQASFSPGTDDDTAPTTEDNAGEYLPAGARSIADDDVEQGQLLNLETFEHAGVVTLADAETGGTGPVAGDVLVVTGAATAGTDGGGAYVADGGELRLDTVLNGGGAASESDVLVVDDTQLGTSAVTLTVTNALAGQGALTDTNGNGMLDAGEGILVVEVLGTSAADVFTMAPVRDGAFEYTLEQGADGNWYLVAAQLPGPQPIPAASLGGVGVLALLLSLMGYRRLGAKEGRLKL